MSKVPAGAKCEITVEQSYPDGVPDLPTAHEFVRFGHGPLAPGEVAVDNDGRYFAPMLTYSWPRIIVRRVPAKPHPFDMDRGASFPYKPCATCGLSEYDSIHKVAKPRRWIVEFPDYPQAQFGPSSTDGEVAIKRVYFIREVQPITREKIGAAIPVNWPKSGVVELARDVLKALGIEVED